MLEEVLRTQGKVLRHQDSSRPLILHTDWLNDQITVKALLTLYIPEEIARLVHATDLA